MTKRQIIFDADIGGDCDDASALALALELALAGECSLAAVTSCTENASSAGCIEAFFLHYGVPAPAIGYLHPPRDGGRTTVCEDVYAAEAARARHALCPGRSVSGYRFGAAPNAGRRPRAGHAGKRLCRGMRMEHPGRYRRGADRMRKMAVRADFLQLRDRPAHRHLR